MTLLPLLLEGGRKASSKPLSSNRELASVDGNSKEHGCFLTGFTLKRMSSNYGLVMGPSLLQQCCPRSGSLSSWANLALFQTSRPQECHHLPCCSGQKMCP